MTTDRRALLKLSGLAALGAAGGAAGVSSVQALPPSGSDDDLQRRYDALAHGNGGTLDIPAGTMAVSLDLYSRRVNLRGAGRGATILQPRDPARPVLNIRYADASWDAVTISDLTIQGEGDKVGVGLGHSNDDDARFVGRTILQNVKFSHFEKCIARPQGNIGLWLEDCQFEDAAYHLWGESTRSASGAVMQNGVLVARRCHFQRASIAVMRSRSDVAGSGQVSFEDCIFENNPGFVFVFERFESRDAVPGIVLRSCWNERNATGSNRLRLGGRDWAPAFLFADSVASIECHDTPPGAAILLGDTSFTTRACALDLFEIAYADRAAAVTHHDARIFGDKVVDGLTVSLTNANMKNMGPTGPIFRLPHRSASIRPVLMGRHDTNACRSPISIDGSRRSVTRSVRDTVLPGETVGQEVALAAGDHIFLNRMVVPPGVFVAWTFCFRRVAGAPPIFQVTGSEAISTTMPLMVQDWTTIGGIAWTDKPIAQLGFWLKAEHAATIRVGGYQLVCLSSRQAATELLNDRLFRDVAAS